MSDLVLFSPLGTSDPTRGNYDGAFLHIVRHYKPKKVYLFMTKLICEYDENNNRYEVMAKAIYPDIEIVKLKHPEIDNPSDFEIFDPLFEKYLNEIVLENPNSEILINVSSGTPQMKISIYLLAVRYYKPLRIIQVPTEEKGANKTSPVSLEYDIDEELANLYDNLEEHENRCKEQTPKNVRKMLMVEIVGNHIKAYDYEAAYNAITNLAEFFPVGLIAKIESMNYRTKMELSKCKLKLPIETSGIREKFEYILLLQLKQIKGNLIDFARGVSPILTDLFEEFLKMQFTIDIRKYCVGGEVQKLNGNLLPQDVLEYYERYFNGNFRNSELSSSNIIPYIEYMYKNESNKSMLEVITKLRDFEREFRNFAAHEIVSISDDKIKMKINTDSKGVLEHIEKLFTATFQKKCGNNIAWNAYDIVNVEIINELNGR